MATGAALLEQMRARQLAEQREAVQRQLVEDLGHELRTPLATLLTLAQGARLPRQDPARVVQRLEWIEESVGEANRLVERLLELAAVERRLLAPGTETAETLDEELASISQVVRRSVRKARILAAPRGITLELDERHPSARRVDAASLEVVLRNLLMNAVAHSPEGGRVEVRAQREDGGLRLEVEDHGEGIAPEHLERIFDRLWRADPARSRSDGRYGLGLAIARRHAELLGAGLTVRSRPGVGSVFALSLDDSQPSRET